MISEIALLFSVAYGLAASPLIDACVKDRWQVFLKPDSSVKLDAPGLWESAHQHQN